MDWGKTLSLEQLSATDLASLPRVSRLTWSKLRSRDSGAQAATFRPSHQNQRETYAQKNMSLDCFPTAVECLEHWSLDTNFKKTSWMAVQSYEPQFPLYIFFTPARLLSGSDQR